MSYLKFVFLGLILAGISSCYKEVELPPISDVVFELNVTPGMQEFIYNSRDTSYSISEPGMEFFLDERPLALKEIKTRGKTALDYQRKSFAVVLKEGISIPGRKGQDISYLTRFKLISLAMDYTYIESRIGFGILEENGIMPLFYRFVELKINGSTQGIYLLIEDPEKFYLGTGSEFILRRGYYNSMPDVEYAPSYQNISRETYETRFKEIYSRLSELQGEELYIALNQRLDLDQYFRKMGIDYLLQNGDYTDEVYLYALIHQKQIRFSIIPWDYDDLFSSYPHEVGKNWGTGRVLGDRQYNTYQDVLDEIGEKLVYSIEDDLDYSIAMDPYLYARYENTLSEMIEEMDAEDIDYLFEQLKLELTPYYSEEELVLQSRFDQRETSFSIWEENMEEKKMLIKTRLEAMKEKLREAKP